jgi:hypothetical protein
MPALSPVHARIVAITVARAAVRAAVRGGERATGVHACTVAVAPAPPSALPSMEEKEPPRMPAPSPSRAVAVPTPLRPYRRRLPIGITAFFSYFLISILFRFLVSFYT